LIITFPLEVAYTHLGDLPPVNELSFLNFMSYVYYILSPNWILPNPDKPFWLIFSPQITPLVSAPLFCLPEGVLEDNPIFLKKPPKLV
jgi:hypothetical protein